MTAERDELIGRLRQAGATEEQIEAAVAEDRLALLPTELLLSRDCEYSVEEAVELSGLEQDFLVRHLVATGMVRPAPGEKVLSETNLEALKRTRRALDAGIPEETVLRLDKVFNRGVAQVADGTVDVIFAEFLRHSTNEAEFGLQIEELARAMRGDLAVYLAATMETHLRERLARAALTRAEVEAGRLPGARDVAVCFADLVDFTRISDRRGPEETTKIAVGFADLAAEVAEPPVRLVKMIGDEAMLVCGELDPLLDAAFALRERARETGLPALRIGLTVGPALERAGDWYGRTVNLASRITAEAPEGALVVPAEVCAQVDDRVEVEQLGDVSLKGLDEPIELCRLESSRRTEYPGRDSNPHGPKAKGF
jgi:adenylate cyclase